jgi:hypothetical protein
MCNLTCPCGAYRFGTLLTRRIPAFINHLLRQMMKLAQRMRASLQGPYSSQLLVPPRMSKPLMTAWPRHKGPWVPVGCRKRCVISYLLFNHLRCWRSGNREWESLYDFRNLGSLLIYTFMLDLISTIKDSRYKNYRQQQMEPCKCSFGGCGWRAMRRRNWILRATRSTSKLLIFTVIYVCFWILFINKIIDFWY